MLGFLTDNCIRYGESLIYSGADVIAISDPSATGEILGPKMFSEFALPYLNKMITHVHALGKPVIVHICGNISSICEALNGLYSECISVDSSANMRVLKDALYGKKLMGNVCTRLLQNGNVNSIRSVSKNLIDFGIDILAPTCGLSAKTPLTHIKAMTESAKESSKAKILCRT